MGFRLFWVSNQFYWQLVDGNQLGARTIPTDTHTMYYASAVKHQHTDDYFTETTLHSNCSPVLIVIQQAPKQSNSERRYVCFVRFDDRQPGTPCGCSGSGVRCRCVCRRPVRAAPERGEPTVGKETTTREVEDTHTYTNTHTQTHTPARAHAHTHTHTHIHTIYKPLDVEPGQFA